MSAKGSTAMEVFFDEVASALFRATRKCCPAIAAAATTASTDRTASIHTLYLLEELFSSKGPLAGPVFSSVADSSIADDVAATSGSAALSSRTGATNRYPRLGKVS